MSDMVQYLQTTYGIHPDEDTIYVTPGTRAGKAWIYWPARNILKPFAARFRKPLIPLHYHRLKTRGSGTDSVLGGFQHVQVMARISGIPEPTLRKYIGGLRRALRGMGISPDEVITNCDMPECFGYRLGRRVIVLLDAREKLPSTQEPMTL